MGILRQQTDSAMRLTAMLCSVATPACREVPTSFMSLSYTLTPCDSFQRIRHAFSAPADDVASTLTPSASTQPSPWFWSMPSLPSCRFAAYMITSEEEIAPH